MIYPNFRKFDRRAREGDWVPVWTTVPADLLTPVSAYLKLTHGLRKRSRGAAQFSFLLESVEGGENVARYTYLGADPEMVLRYWIGSGGSGKGSIEVRVAGKKHEQTLQGDFYSLSQQFFAGYRAAPAEGLPPFINGAVGYFGYDMVSLREPVPLPKEQEKKTNRKPMPDAVLMFASTVIVFDHVKHQLWIVCNVACEESLNRAQRQRRYQQAVRKVEQIKRDLEGPLPSSVATTSLAERKSALPAFRSNFSKAQFAKQVRRAKQYITAGDIFQVVLSQRLETKLRAKPFEVYRALRQVNPAPYLFFLEMGDDVVLGSSPEMLVKVTGKDVEYRPIAGTRKRGIDAAEDARLERELLADEKERAEHVMLVDLGRNDVGRVSEYGSVRVPNLMFVERYSHVMHLVSSVRGKLRKELNASDALWACFPAGTVTGAPKVRAMQIISELEPTRRGVYAGSVLYFDVTGNLNSCIAIRSIVIRNGKGYVQVGAGIVADSVPEREFEETMNKGKAMLTAIGMAEAAGRAGKRASGRASKHPTAVMGQFESAGRLCKGMASAMPNRSAR